MFNIHKCLWTQKMVAIFFKFSYSKNIRNFEKKIRKSNNVHNFFVKGRVVEMLMKLNKLSPIQSFFMN